MLAEGRGFLGGSVGTEGLRSSARKLFLMITVEMEEGGRAGSAGGLLLRSPPLPLPPSKL